MASDFSLSKIPDPKASTVIRRLGYEAGQNLRLITAGVAIFIILLLAVSFWVSKKGGEADEAVAHTVRNERLISLVQSQLQEAEISQRGFLLTGDTSYLEPYDKAASTISTSVEALGLGVSDNRRQDGNIAVLRSLSTQKLSELRQNIERRRAGDEAAAVSGVRGGQGKVLMDGVRDVLERMRTEEENLMTLRANQARRAGFVLEVMVIGLALLTALMGAIAVRATLRRARSAEASRDELLQRLDRKLLAIMAADIVGYSRMMEGDETQTLSRLKDVRDRIDPIIAGHGGSIVTTAGDSVLVAFASALSAIDCAVEIQGAMAADNAELPEDEHLMFRIGINVGDVIVQDGDVFGDTVNVAARLEPVAEPGGICISRAVRDHIRKQRHLSFEDLGFLQVKNIAHPVSAFRVRFEHGARVVEALS
ncbi:adenylate/guanylate cyclase domain-containing protein [Pararhizobium polonicum]|uniref:adenylate/guanylate cyclase domain-containing protein n=1 Tax=Pararhizobium polonicum TaxID=1612624 RepID=UPI00083A2AA6|nr:CHASE3 domain-containing protein [Pararhizobium polonicum]